MRTTHLKKQKTQKPAKQLNKLKRFDEAENTKSKKGAVALDKCELLPVKRTVKQNKIFVRSVS